MTVTFGLGSWDWSSERAKRDDTEPQTEKGPRKLGILDKNILQLI